jgi:archaellum component FlaC
MVAMDVEGEIRDLKRRVGELEGGFGFLTQQVRAVHLDLLNFQSQTNQRFDKIEAEVRGVKAQMTTLREDLPAVVGNVMREVLREQKR